jgi:dTDP-4-amino-4,6-dideoxygalactose transaminase
MTLLKPKKFKIKNIFQDNKTIRVIEKGNNFNFSFDRNYIINNHNSLNFSGFHAHKKLYQLVFCIKGKAEIILDNKKTSYSFKLDNSDYAVLIPPGFWRILKLQRNSIISVLASNIFKKSDYIKDYNKLNTKREISFNGTHHCNEALKVKFTQILENVIDKNELVLGKSVRVFEKKFATFVNTKHAISCGNGHDALLLILKALNISNGDEILVPTNSFIATALSGSNNGANIVFLDCNSDNYGIDINDLKKKINKKTKALIVVHLFGIPDNISEIRKICKKKNIYLIEDASQAHGAEIDGKKVGGFGIASFFSFYPTKNLGALGDGGCIVTNNTKLNSLILSLRNYGKDCNNDFTYKGINSRLDSLQAEFLLEKMNLILSWNKKRKMIAKYYYKYLKNLSSILLPIISENVNPVWHIFPIKCLDNSRKNLIIHLSNMGIETNIHYPVPIHKTKSYKTKDILPNAEKNSRQLLSLPMHPFLTKEDVIYISSSIKDFYQ